MLTRVRHWLRAAFLRGSLDREMKREMQQHIDRATERFVASGMSPGDARNAARREFGNVAYLEEQGRDARGAAWLESVRSDLRYSVRALRASPAFATVAILSLAIGIGANTAIFSLINAVMLKTLPVERPSEIVQVRMRDSAAASGPGNAYFTNPIWEAIRDRTGASARYVVSGNSSFNLATGGVERRASGMWVNGDFFNALGVRPVAGRLLTIADDYRGCPAIAVVSYGFWQSELGGRAEVVGRSITLSDQPFTVIGVAPAGFFGVDVGQATQIYAPLCAVAREKGRETALDERRQWWIRVMARPNPGVSFVQFNARLRAASRGVFEATMPARYDAKNRAEYAATTLAASPAGNGMSAVREQYSRALVVLMAMVGVILLISCANVANLLLARGAARSREMAIRIAIGASRTRLIRQFLTESILLAAAGAMIGIVLASWGSRVLVGMLGDEVSNAIALDLSLDLRVLGFTALVSVATVILFGLVPAWRATRVDPQSAMKAGGRGTIDGHSRFRIGKALVVAQSALALILVVGAGLLVGTFHQLASIDPGFKSDGVLIATVDLQRTGIPRSQVRRTQWQLLERFRAIPGVRAASVADVTPVSGNTWNDDVVVGGAEGLTENDRLALFNKVSDGYFQTMGTHLLAGRDFAEQDTPRSTQVAIVNRAMVDRFFRGTSPLGRTYQVQNNSVRSAPVMIVGVVEDTKYQTLREKPQPIVYVAASQDSLPYGWTTYQLSIAGSPAAITEAVKSIATAVDPRTSLTFKMLSDQVAESLQRERVLAMLSGFFGTIALLLAMIGLYGVMAYTVARRRVEIGIRIALGAARSRVVRLVLGDVGRMIGIGIVLGGVGAVAATRVLKSFLFGVTASDPMTMVGAAVLLALAAIVAGAIPAGRAARLEPVEALRED